MFALCAIGLVWAGFGRRRRRRGAPRNELVVTAAAPPQLDGGVCRQPGRVSGFLLPIGRRGVTAAGRAVDVDTAAGAQSRQRLQCRMRTPRGDAMKHAHASMQTQPQPQPQPHRPPPPYPHPHPQPSPAHPHPHPHQGAAALDRAGSRGDRPHSAVQATLLRRAATVQCHLRNHVTRVGLAAEKQHRKDSGPWPAGRQPHASVTTALSGPSGASQTQTGCPACFAAA
jgi:hypothetical protein